MSRSKEAKQFKDEVLDLVREDGSPAFKCRNTGSGHYFFTDAQTGKPVLSMAATPSDHRAMKNMVNIIRRHGFPDFRRK